MASIEARPTGRSSSSFDQNSATRIISALFNDTGAGAPPVLFVGGDFASAGTLSTHSLARWGCPWPSQCYANCDGSNIPPVLNVQDFSCFLGRWANNDTYANCDLSTVAPVLNVQDFTCFLNAFARGCGI